MNLVEIILKPIGGWKPKEDYALVFDKFKAIEEYVKGKDVLDCGCIGHRVDETELFRRISNTAKYCVGVDIQRQELERLASEGLKVVHSDVESLEIDKTFDVVFAGELIEHLSNPGVFLDKIREVLKDGGKLILTTPNPHFLSIIIRKVFGKRITVNREHTCWHTPETIKQLLTRHGFTVDKIYWYQSSPRWWINFIVRLREDLARSMIVYATKTSYV